MIKTDRVTKLGPVAKGPFSFLRYVGRDRLTVELVDPVNINNENGRLLAKTFKESTSNVAKVLVDYD